VGRADVYIKHGSNKKVRKTTKGFLADFKDSNPVEVVDYDVCKNLHDAPAFGLWFPRVLKKRSHIIADVTNIYHKMTHKSRIEVPKSWDDCMGRD
jgi:hypothetical protein